MITTTKNSIKKTTTKILTTAIINLMIVFHPQLVNASNALAKFSQMKNAGMLMLDQQGQVIISDHAQTPYIPASTTKLVTAWLALQHWGEGHHFQTHFYFDNASKTLWIKGSGDPFLVSEEINLIAKNIVNHLNRTGISSINAIGMDTSLFKSNLVMPGTGRTNNPYDAVPSAIAANFNTVNIKKIKGKVVSAEAQTPLTPYAKSMSKRFKSGKLRVNTGRNPRDAEKYFGELLTAFLRQQGIVVGSGMIGGKVPPQALQNKIYTHANSKSVGEMIRPMMKYSTNFIANQLVLMMSADRYGRPANANDVQQYMQQSLAQRFRWKDFTMKDGAGLSRANRLSPKQLVDLLQAFKPWKYLLPEIESGVYAKSGTLNKVSTLAGYIQKNGQLQPFAIMMNQGVPYKLRNRIARELARK